jgi:selenide,water dikinase
VRNWNSYGHKIGSLTELQRVVLADPQTSGGLLVAVKHDGAEEFEALLKTLGLPEECCRPFGWLEDRGVGPLIGVR